MDHISTDRPEQQSTKPAESPTADNDEVGTPGALDEALGRVPVDGGEYELEPFPILVFEHLICGVVKQLGGIHLHGARIEMRRLKSGDRVEIPDVNELDAVSGGRERGSPTKGLARVLRRVDADHDPSRRSFLHERRMTRRPRCRQGTKSQTVSRRGSKIVERGPKAPVAETVFRVQSNHDFPRLDPAR